MLSSIVANMAWAHDIQMMGFLASPPCRGFLSLVRVQGLTYRSACGFANVHYDTNALTKDCGAGKHREHHTKDEPDSNSRRDMCGYRMHSALVDDLRAFNPPNEGDG